MDDATDVRIVTNATLNEIAGRLSGRHDVEIDVPHGRILYHESQNLLSPEYRNRIVACIRQVGYDARFVSVRLNPPPPVPTVDGPFQDWPDRFTADITVSGAATHADMNRIVDAIAYARLGRDDPRIDTDISTGSVTIRSFEGLALARSNIEFAIARAGFDANGVPANPGGPDAAPVLWTPTTTGAE